jgi:DNA-binding protein H-NS
MDEFGITHEDLAGSLQRDLDRPPLYRDARGNEWNGLGDMPDWMRAAKNAGVNPDFFRIESKPAAPNVDAQKDATVGTFNPRQLDLFF